MKKLMPQDGGCWYCYTAPDIKGDEPLLFSSEFDTYLHKSCLIKRILSNPEDREAIIMAKELKLLKKVDETNIKCRICNSNMYVPEDLLLHASPSKIRFYCTCGHSEEIEYKKVFIKSPINPTLTDPHEIEEYMQKGILQHHHIFHTGQEILLKALLLASSRTAARNIINERKSNKEVSPNFDEEKCSRCIYKEHDCGVTSPCKGFKEKKNKSKGPSDTNCGKCVYLHDDDCGVPDHCKGFKPKLKLELETNDTPCKICIHMKSGCNTSHCKGFKLKLYPMKKIMEEMENVEKDKLKDTKSEQPSQQDLDLLKQFDTSLRNAASKNMQGLESTFHKVLKEQIEISTEKQLNTLLTSPEIKEIVDKIVNESINSIIKKFSNI